MDVLRTGLGLVESPPWHGGRLWFSDWIAGEIIAVDDAGVFELMVRHESLPLCFDLLPAAAIGADVSLSGRRVWADLGDAAPDGICLDAEGAA